MKKELEEIKKLESAINYHTVAIRLQAEKIREIINSLQVDGKTT